ncbi:MAG: hypothetical protein JNJ50_13945 [Acidobacteria bacterium]|nr:hypothetical protein [Acidobacteriota bacterium]
MFRHSSLRAVFWSLTMCLLLAAPALAQKKGGKTSSIPVEITILNVTKKDAMAKPAPDGAGRVIPVEVQWKAEGEARLVNLEAVLKTSNTDGSTSEVKMMLNEKATQGMLMLKMPNGVFAREYTLTLLGKCIWDGGQGTSRANKSGAFPLPPDAKK